MDLELNRLTREGKNICPVCNEPKIMYFVPWCPRCGKDDAIGTSQVVNVVQALGYFAAIDGSKEWGDDAWDTIIDFLGFPDNNTYHRVDIKDILEGKSRCTVEVVSVFHRIAEHFELDDTVTLYFCW